ncbi:MAG: type IV pili methyl-accepting chemotaxis transducer N-terminal domain-containing protein, partial [Eisenbergiella massiliensis]
FLILVPHLILMRGDLVYAWRSTMQKKIMPIILIVALLVTGHLSLISIHGLQGNSRVINYTGVVRGATQRLVKQELNGQHNDALIKRLDGILAELATGEGGNNLIRLDDDDFQRLVARMQEEWESLKKEIVKVRQGESKTALYELSGIIFPWRTGRSARRRNVRSGGLRRRRMCFLP